MDEEWQSVDEANTANEKASIFQNLLLDNYNEYFPKKTIKVTNEDQPWFTKKLKKLDRQRKRIYCTNRRSDKWKKLDKLFKKEVKHSKADFYKKMVEDLKTKDPKKWYSAVKRMASYENKSDKLILDEINHLTDQEKCDIIADDFTKIPNQYSPLHKEDITIPAFQSSEIQKENPLTIISFK